MTRVGTAERIAAAALAILIDEGAQAVTMRRVAADAGVTTMATYRHYPNREELLRAVTETAFMELGKEWGTRVEEVDFESRFFGLLDDFLAFSLGEPNLYHYLITDRREGARQILTDYRESPAFGPVVDTVEQGMREGVLRSDDSVEVALAITMSTVGLVQLYLGGRIALSESDFRALCNRTVRRVIDGFRA